MTPEAKDRIELQAAATYDWLAAHPGLFWFLLGVVIGKFIL